MNQKLKDLISKSGLSVDHYQIRGYTQDLEKLIKSIVEECAVVAEQTSRSFSDGDAGVGSAVAAQAVRHYGETLFK